MARLTPGLPRRASLRTRMALLSGLACVFVAALLSLGLYVVAQRFVQQAQLARLNSAALLLAGRVQNSLTFGQSDPDDLTRQDVPPDIQVRVSLGRSVLILSRQFPRDLPLNVSPGVYRLGDRYVLAQPVEVQPFAGQGRLALLTLSLSSQGTDDARRAFVRATLFILPGVLLLACLASWWAAGRMLRPVAALEQEARLIGESGDLTRPLTGAGGAGGKGTDELSRLAVTLQTSFRQLDETRSREVQFLRSAAHDLRGPLAALTTRVSLSLSRERAPERYRQDLQEALRDIARLSALSEHLLLLARNKQTLGRAPVHLRDVAAEAIDAARSLYPDTDIDLQGGAVAGIAVAGIAVTGIAVAGMAAPGVDVLDITVPDITVPDITVPGDRLLLGQAVSNLLENAHSHAPGAAVRVSLEQQAGQALLSVHDSGPGVDVGVLARLGEAFYRPDSARSRDNTMSDANTPQGGGHGLGLAIVRHVALLHGGTLILESVPGQGFTATLRLPVSVQ